MLIILQIWMYNLISGNLPQNKLTQLIPRDFSFQDSRKLTKKKRLIYVIFLRFSI